MFDHPIAQHHAQAFLRAACTRDACGRLPHDLDRGHLVTRYGLVLGHVLLWLNRTRVRHQLGRLAEDAPDAILSDIGVSRTRIAREAARRFWQELELR